MQVSGRGVGCEQIGERTAGLTGEMTAEPTGDLMVDSAGELMGDLVVKVGGGEVGSLAGGVEAAGSVGEMAVEGSRTGTGDWHGGLLAAGEGEGVVLSGCVSSGRNGSGKKRVPGLFSRGT